MHREHLAIRELAYQLWVDRGCPAGSAERDWLEAERQLSARSQTPRAASSASVDESLKDTYPASDPPASHLPDVPPANAEAKWEAAAAASEDAKRGTGSRRRSTPDASPPPRAPGRRGMPPRPPGQ
ncbi:MAG TPA: DUF2934 domain-containing protein [Steroidobacteraceae bacterium]|jgi:hypothetical protein|nr:DUF2934 domain-containing protein [Steroidobacteraceae bacterium]